MSDCCSVPKKADTHIPSVMACPSCGARSKKVELLTVKSLVRHLPLGSPPAQYYFCEAQGCDVVYFAADSAALVFRSHDLLVRVGCKETEDPIPVCYCFGFTRREIAEEAAREGRSAAAEAVQAEVRAGRCACEVKNPSGKCCLGEITRIAESAKREKQGHAVPQILR